MFDQYQPSPTPHCPYCDGALGDWQGKDGPCLLLVWRQGVAAPVEQMGDAANRVAAEHLLQFRLPEEFDFMSPAANCRFCPYYGIGKTENHIWISTILVVPSDAPFNEQVDLNADSSGSPHIWRREGGAT